MSRKWRTKLIASIGRCALRRKIIKYMKKNLHDESLIVCWTKNEKTDGAFDNLPVVCRDFVKLRRAINLGGYYFYQGRWRERYFPTLSEDEQARYNGWAERTTRNAYRRIVERGDSDEKL